jgi:hypothetical protein
MCIVRDTDTVDAAGVYRHGGVWSTCLAKCSAVTAEARNPWRVVRP